MDTCFARNKYDVQVTSIVARIMILDLLEYTSGLREL